MRNATAFPRGRREPSPAEYARDAEALRQVFSEDVILVLSALPSYVRNRLIQRRVPFIVPGTQMFLPMLMIDLREQYPRRAGGSKARLSSVAQVVIIYHLIRASISDVPLGIIAQQLQYSAMSLSKAQEELQEAGICEVERSGKALFLRFEGSRPAIWLRAIPFLSTPVKKTQWVRFGSSQPHAFKAGLTALSADTMLADDSIPTLAMRNRDLLGALRQGDTSI